MSQIPDEIKKKIEDEAKRFARQDCYDDPWIEKDGKKIMTNYQYTDKDKMACHTQGALFGYSLATMFKEEWELGENGKPQPPRWLQEKVISIVNEQMEKYIAAGCLNNRFSIRNINP